MKREVFHCIAITLVTILGLCTLSYIVEIRPALHSQAQAREVQNQVVAKKMEATDEKMSEAIKRRKAFDAALTNVTLYVPSTDLANVPQSEYHARITAAILGLEKTKTKLKDIPIPSPETIREIDKTISYLKTAYKLPARTKTIDTIDLAFEAIRSASQKDLELYNLSLPI
jgi:hypothetical protein